MNIINKFLGEAFGEVLYNITEAQNTGDELWYRIIHPDTMRLERAVASDGCAIYVTFGQTLTNQNSGQSLRQTAMVKKMGSLRLHLFLL